MTEEYKLAEDGADLSPVLVELVSVLSVPQIAAPMVRVDVKSASTVVDLRAVVLGGVRNRSMKKSSERLGCETGSVTKSVPVRERGGPEPATIAPVRSVGVATGSSISSGSREQTCIRHLLHLRLWEVVKCLPKRVSLVIS